MKHFKLLLIVLAVIVLSWFNSNTVAGDEDFTEIVTETTETTDTVVDETEQEKLFLIEKVDTLVGNESVSTAIVEACMKHTEDYRLCIKNVIWVSNAESWMFKASMKPSNNWFWWMEWWKKKRFSSVEDSIYQWVKMYKRLWWDNRTTWESRLKWKYCASECTNWVYIYNDWIRKLGL